MVDGSTLSMFLLAVFALFLSPGPNMAFVLSHGVAHGPRGGFAAALGITAADLLLTVLTATGLTAIATAWPPSFELLRYLGVAYLIWLAFQALRRPGWASLAGGEHRSAGRIFRMALLNSLLNPKALLFFMVFLPQFVVATRGHIALQLAILGCTLSASALLFNSVLGAFSGQIGTVLNRNPRAVKSQPLFLAGVLAFLAMRLLLLDRPTGVLKLRPHLTERSPSDSHS